MLWVMLMVFNYIIADSTDGQAEVCVPPPLPKDATASNQQLDLDATASNQQLDLDESTTEQPPSSDAALLLLQPVDTNKTEGSFSCKVCNKDFTRKDNLDRHLQKHSGSMYNWAHCDRAFYSKHALTEHLRVVMSGPYTCDS